jgi:hypothetical protein
MDVARALAGNWEFRVDHKGIRIFSSKMKGSRVLGFKAETEFPVSFKKLVSLFHDFGSYGRWVHHMTEMEVLNRNEDLEYVIRQVINAPWPLLRREMISRTSLHTAGEGAIAVMMDGVPDYLPANPLYHRVRELRGVWVLLPMEGGRVHITFVMHVNPGSDVPPAVSNTALFDVPFHSLHKLRALATNPSYNPPWPEEVDEHLHIIEDDSDMP